ncbi:MAG: response regulator [Candidatus Omnitrophica bacterium]|nr:response regulator [Candidatus Omnitrophota bacterium]
MSKKKVMVIDDNQEFLEELKEMFSLNGYSTVTINDSLLAREAAILEKPDIILLDLKMPGKSGFQVADEIRSFSQLYRVPIIAMTGVFKENYGPLLNICGIKKCLKKPFSPLDIIAEIESSLREHAPAKQPLAD